MEKLCVKYWVHSWCLMDFWRKMAAMLRCFINWLPGGWKAVKTGVLAFWWSVAQWCVLSECQKWKSLPMTFITFFIVRSDHNFGLHSGLQGFMFFDITWVPSQCEQKHHSTKKLTKTQQTQWAYKWIKSQNTFICHGFQ